MAHQADITMLVTDCLGNLSLQSKQISRIVTFYTQVGIDNLHKSLNGFLTNVCKLNFVGRLSKISKFKS